MNFINQFSKWRFEYCCWMEFLCTQGNGPVYSVGGIAYRLARIESLQLRIVQIQVIYMGKGKYKKHQL